MSDGERPDALYSQLRILSEKVSKLHGEVAALEGVVVTAVRSSGDVDIIREGVLRALETHRGLGSVRFSPE